MLKTTIQQLSQDYFDDIVAIRRHIHQHPELSYQEVQTAQFIQDTLTSWGITTFHTLCQTGTVVLLQGKNPHKRTIALRADIDALPIQEQNNVPYKSQNPGIMHACGHDVHTACLLGAIKILHHLRHQWEGTIKCIFQPGEEKNPGGASLMIKEGVLQNPPVSKIIALHVNTLLDVGKFNFRQGKCMASADELYITINGNGGHAAAPHTTQDTIAIAAHLILSLQNLISRQNDPFNPSVLTISAIHAGNTTNVIPTQVKMMGTFRAMDEQWRYTAHKKIQDIINGISQTFGVSIDLFIDIGYPMVYNDPALTSQVLQLAQDFIGQDHCGQTELRMGAEDFGYYTQHIPGCFFRLGIKNQTKNITSGVHTPTFDIDENALKHGMAMFAWLGVHIQ